MEIYFRGLDREEVSRIGLEAARRAEFAMDADAAREIGRYASRAPVRRNGRRLQFRIDSYIIRCYRATGPVQLSIM